MAVSMRLIPLPPCNDRATPPPMPHCTQEGAHSRPGPDAASRAQARRNAPFHRDPDRCLPLPSLLGRPGERPPVGPPRPVRKPERTLRMGHPAHSADCAPTPPCLHKVRGLLGFCRFLTLPPGTDPGMACRLQVGGTQTQSRKSGPKSKRRLPQQQQSHTT